MGAGSSLPDCQYYDNGINSSHPTIADLYNAGAKTTGSCAIVGAGPAGSVASHVTIPDGFVKSDEVANASHYCSNSPGNKTDSSIGCNGINGCATVGNQLKVCLNNYNDRDTCCKTGANYTANGVCDPAWSTANYSNGQCSTSLTPYCALPENINSSVCQNFINAQASNSQVIDMMKTYCSSGDNIKNDANCTNYNNTLNPNALDDVAVAYCKSNPTQISGFCSCINLPSASEMQLDDATFKLLRWCDFNRCSTDTSGYKTAAQKQNPCNNAITICKSSINATAGGNINLNNINLSQNCSSSTNSGTTTTPATATSGSQAAAYNSSTSNFLSQVESEVTSHKGLSVGVGIGSFIISIILLILSIYASLAK